jgi:hypothetical protein
MTPTLRWRILVLQIGLTAVLAFCAGFLFWGANYTHSNVRDQLVAQKIAFPPAVAFSPKEYPASALATLRGYAGQPVDNGPKAKAYADDFIAVHLNAVANGRTYSEVSAAYLKNPKNVQLQVERTTLFMGTMLRASLLQAYGWWQVGDYAFYAAIGLTIAALLVFLAFLFELLVAPRREEARAGTREQRRGAALPSA